MSDFLTRLAQRSLGEAPVIRPRLPGLFAPLNEGEAAGGEIAAFDSEHQSRPDAAISASALPLLGEKMGDSSAVDRVRASPLSTVGEETNGTVRGPTPPRQRRQAPAHDEHDPASTRPVPEPSFANASRSSGERPDASGSSSASLPAAELPGERRLTPAPRPLVAEPGKLRASESRAGVASAIALSDREPGQSPTVHITIGRVEVRASMATPPPALRPSREDKPTLSLGDYLKRGGGKA